MKPPQPRRRGSILTSRGPRRLAKGGEAFRRDRTQEAAGSSPARSTKDSILKPRGPLAGPCGVSRAVLEAVRESRPEASIRRSKGPARVPVTSSSSVIRKLSKMAWFMSRRVRAGASR